MRRPRGPWWTVAAVTAVLAALPTPASAQRDPEIRVCAEPPAPSGDGEHAIFLEVWRVERNALQLDVDPDHRRALERLLQGVGGSFVPPARIDVAIGPSTAFTRIRARQDVLDSAMAPVRAPSRQSIRDERRRGDSVTRFGEEQWPSIRGQVRFTLHEDGAITGLGLARTTGSAALDSAVVLAVAQADSMRILAGVASRAGGVDSLPLALYVTAERDQRSVGEELFRVRLPHYRVIPVQTWSGRHAGPRYPPGALQAGREGKVLVRFDIDASGAYDGTTTRALIGESDFVAAVLDALPSARFRPAHVNGCAVRVDVTQPFEFGISTR